MLAESDSGLTTYDSVKAFNQKLTLKAKSRVIGNVSLDKQLGRELLNEKVVQNKDKLQFK